MNACDEAIARQGTPTYAFIDKWHSFRSLKTVFIACLDNGEHKFGGFAVLADEIRQSDFGDGISSKHLTNRVQSESPDFTSYRSKIRFFAIPPGVEIAVSFAEANRQHDNNWRNDSEQIDLPPLQVFVPKADRQKLVFVGELDCVDWNERPSNPTQRAYNEAINLEVMQKNAAYLGVVPQDERTLTSAERKRALRISEDALGKPDQSVMIHNWLRSPVEEMRERLEKAEMEVYSRIPSAMRLPQAATLNADEPSRKFHSDLNDQSSNSDTNAGNISARGDNGASNTSAAKIATTSTVLMAATAFEFASLKANSEFEIIDGQTSSLLTETPNVAVTDSLLATSKNDNLETDASGEGASTSGEQFAPKDQLLDPDNATPQHGYSAEQISGLAMSKGSDEFSEFEPGGPESLEERLNQDLAMRYGPPAATRSYEPENSEWLSQEREDEEILQHQATVIDAATLPDSCQEEESVEQEASLQVEETVEPEPEVGLAEPAQPDIQDECLETEEKAAAEQWEAEQLAQEAEEAEMGIAANEQAVIENEARDADLQHQQWQLDQERERERKEAERREIEEADAIKKAQIADSEPNLPPGTGGVLDSAAQTEVPGQGGVLDAGSVEANVPGTGGVLDSSPDHAEVVGAGGLLDKCQEAGQAMNTPASMIEEAAASVQSEAGFASGIAEPMSQSPLFDAPEEQFETTNYFQVDAAADANAMNWSDDIAQLPGEGIYNETLFAAEFMSGAETSVGGMDMWQESNAIQESEQPLIVGASTSAEETVIVETAMPELPPSAPPAEVVAPIVIQQ